MGADPYEVRSVTRAINILSVLEQAPDGDGLTVSDVARRVGGSKSTIFATLQTLLSHGLVTDSGEGMTRRYRLGLAMIRMGARAADQTSISDVVTPLLRDLSETVGLTSRAAVLDDEGWAVTVARVDAPSDTRLDLRIGRLERPHCTAVGKALMSVIPEARVREILGRIGMPRRTSHTIISSDDFVAHLEKVRTAGYAVDDEEDAMGIVCVAAPAVDLAGTPIAAISVTGLKAGDAMRDLVQVGTAVREQANQLSKALGPIG